MSKVGKTINTITEATAKAGGVVAKNAGEVVSDVAEAMGVDKSKCDHMEQTTSSFGKDLYYYGSNAGKKAEKLTDEVVNKSKQAFDSVVDKFKA